MVVRGRAGCWCEGGSGEGTGSWELSTRILLRGGSRRKDVHEVYWAGGRESWWAQNGMCGQETEVQRFGRWSGGAWALYYERIRLAARVIRTRGC